jgi:integral membrane protein (TIGR00529 family)
MATIIYLIQKGHQLYWGLLGGSVILSIANGHGLIDTAMIVGLALSAPKTLELVLAVTIVSMMISVMSSINLLERMVENLADFLHNPKLTLMGIPALAGGIPVTGGAIISAPLVGQVGTTTDLSNARLAAINIIFRHVSIWVMPFRPHYFLAASLSAIPLFDLVKAQAPLTILGFLAGYWFLLRKAKVKEDGNGVKEEGNGQKPDRLLAGRDFLFYSSPLSAILAGSAFGLRLDLSLLLGLILCLFFAWGHPNFKFQTVVKGIRLDLIMTMCAILVFAKTVQSIEALPNLLQSIVNYGIPFNVLVFIVPLVVGFFTADPTTCVALVFPLLMPLVPLDTKLFYAVVLYAIGLVSYMVSPLHVCQVLTNDHFGIKLMQIYREYWAIQLVLLAGIATLFFLGIYLLA